MIRQNRVTPCLLLLLALATAGAARAQADLIDTSTQCFGMHCCPSGYALRGAHVDQNRFLCRRVSQANEDCFVDHATPRSGMHACPEGTYMRGLRADRNQLTCCYDGTLGGQPFSSEAADTSTQIQGMQACPAQPVTVMTGIHLGQNRFLCAMP